MPFAKAQSASPEFDPRCWAHITHCDGSCEYTVEVRDPITRRRRRIHDSHGGDFHACDQPAATAIGLCEQHAKEIRCLR